MERKTGKDTRAAQLWKTNPRNHCPTKDLSSQKETAERNKVSPSKCSNVVLDPPSEDQTVRKGHPVPVEGEYPVLGKLIGFFN